MVIFHLFRPISVITKVFFAIYSNCIIFTPKKQDISEDFDRLIEIGKGFVTDIELIALAQALEVDVKVLVK